MKRTLDAITGRAGLLPENLKELGAVPPFGLSVTAAACGTITALAIPGTPEIPS
jgi:hypothetical protein